MPRIARLFIVSALGLLILAGSAPDALGYRHHHRGGRNYRGGRGGGNSQMMAMMRAAAIRAAAIQAAHAEIGRAHSALGKTRSRIEREFDLSSTLAAAEKHEGDARAAYEQSLRPVMDRLNKNPEYLDAMASRDELDRKLQLAHSSGTASEEHLTALAKKKLEFGAAATRLKSAAIEADGAASDARDRLTKAGGQLNELKRTHNASILANPEWNSARHDLEKARVNLVAAYTAGNKALTNNRSSRPSQRKQRTK